MKVLILSGGGVRAVQQIAFLRKLLNENPDLNYDCICGTSAGALNAAILATGTLEETIPKAEQIWLHELKGNYSIWRHHLLYYILSGTCLITFFAILALLFFIFTFNKLLTLIFIFLAMASLYVPYLSLKKSSSVYKTDPLRNIIEKHLDLEKLRSSDKILRVGTVCYETGEYKLAKETDYNIIDWIMASSSYPILFPMTFIDGLHWKDGGVLNMNLFYNALKLNPTHIDVIICTPIEVGVEKRLGLSRQLERLLNLIYNDIITDDIAILKSFPNVRVFIASKDFKVGSLSFHPEKIKEMYDETLNGSNFVEK